MEDSGRNWMDCEHPEEHVIEDFRSGDSICTLCGTVLEERRVDFSAETNAFQRDLSWKSLSAIGESESSYAYHSSQLGTYVDKESPYYPEYRNSARAHQSYGQSREQKKIKRIMNHIVSMAARLHLCDQVIDEARELVIKAFEKDKSFRFLSSTIMASGSMVLTTRKLKIITTFREIMHQSEDSNEDVSKCAERLHELFGGLENIIEIGPLAVKYCTLLEQTGLTIKAASCIGKKIQKHKLVYIKKSDALASAAALLAIACTGKLEDLNFLNVSEVSFVPASSIRNAYNALIQIIDVVYPTEIKGVLEKHQLPIIEF